MRIKSEDVDYIYVDTSELTFRIVLNDDKGEDLGKVVDRLHRNKVLVNQAASTNVYISVHNLYTLCCIPVFTVEPV